jgi:hypothetical protein
MSAAEMPAGAAPERTPDWHSIEWKNVWRTVRRLQARIVKAADKQKRPRRARGVSECLSCMNGNIHVQFLGEGVAATSPIRST